MIAFDPKIADEILGFLLICCMAFFYASAQVFSRYLKELDVKFTNACMGGIGFISLLILSIYFEGNTVAHLKEFKCRCLATCSLSWCSLLFDGAYVNVLSV